MLYIFSRKDSDSATDGTIDHIPITRQYSNISQASVEEPAIRETNGKVMLYINFFPNDTF